MGSSGTFSPVRGASITIVRPGVPLGVDAHAAQLAGGSRHLDLRLCKQDGQSYTYHGSLLGGGLSFGEGGEAEEIGRWLGAHPSEVVVIRLSVNASAEEAAEANAEAFDRFAGIAGTERLSARPEFSPSTYGSFVAAGKNVILLDESGRVGTDWAWNASAATSGPGSYPEGSSPAGNHLRDFADPKALSDETITRDRAALARDPGADTVKFFAMAALIQPAPSWARPACRRASQPCPRPGHDLCLRHLLRPPQRGTSSRRTMSPVRRTGSSRGAWPARSSPTTPPEADARDHDQLRHGNGGTTRQVIDPPASAFRSGPWPACPARPTRWEAGRLIPAVLRSDDGERCPRVMG